MEFNFTIDFDRTDEFVQEAYDTMKANAVHVRPEYLTPEHLLYAISLQDRFLDLADELFFEIYDFQHELEEYIHSLDTIPEDEEYMGLLSAQMLELESKLNKDIKKRQQNNGTAPLLGIQDVIYHIGSLKHSKARFILDNYFDEPRNRWKKHIESAYYGSEDIEETELDDLIGAELMKTLDETTEKDDSREMPDNMGMVPGMMAIVNGKKINLSQDEFMKKLHENNGNFFSALQSAISEFGKGIKNPKTDSPRREPWEDMVTDLNATYKDHDPLIGREKELSRAIRILCRREKNNPLFIGEPGVGKTALIYGLVRKIAEGSVPDTLKDSHVYALDMTSMVAGASYHGEFEKRIKTILDGASRRGNCIIYIDEIHSIMNAGGGGGNAMNASDILKPYLESGRICFIGSTTYQDYNKSIANNKAVSRRFAQVDIKEPSTDETIEIINTLIKSFEKHHKVKYTKEAIEYAVEQSNALINDRFLPDKAIDIIDEAGALLQEHPLLDKNGNRKQARYQKVGIEQIKSILTELCRIDAKALTSSSNEDLKNLDKRIAKLIYGQDEAIKQVVRSVMMSKAGLGEPDKPLASLLFVGPTGVGKTEVCKVLAQELGMQLVRFDMSEYTEKHTVSKLIGSPAGYVGYEEGGLLTDAVRKTPNCVLLLDEIEKAHADIYNILLQVMDYAKLTDNKGNKADFKNVILIMTSNAGAQFAAQASIGFGGGQSKGQAMMATVKKTFKPEFLNRLSGTVVFNDMDEKMAGMILDKKLEQLSERLKAKNVTMSLTKEARTFLLTKGFTKQYGAREMDRAIQQYLTPLFMEAILFGNLKKGGDVKVEMESGNLILTKKA